MANLLYNLGQFSARKAWVVIVSWFLLLAIAIASYFNFSGTLTSAVSIPDTPTQKVAEQLKADIPDVAGGSAVVVLHAENGSFTQQQQQQVAGLLKDVEKLDAVSGTVNPFVAEQLRVEQREEVDAGLAKAAAAEQQLATGTQPNASGASQVELEKRKNELEKGKLEAELGKELLDYAAGAESISADGDTAIITIMLEKEAYELETADKEDIIAAVNSNVPDGVTAEFSQELAETVPHLLGIGEIIGLTIAVLVLLVLMRAALPAIIPVFSAVVGIGIGVSGALAFSGKIDMMVVSPVLGVMLGLAVGIDYSLFIINRHRTQLKQGMPVFESIGLANGTSGNAVVFAGVTVVTALLGLNITGIPFLGVMGNVAAACVVIAVLIAVTLTPALLGLSGMRVLPRGKQQENRNGNAKPMSTRGAIIKVVFSAVALSLVALPALEMRLGLPTGATEPESSTQHRAYVRIEEEFGEGYNAPLLLVARYESGSSVKLDTLTRQHEIAEAVSGIEGVSAIAPIGVNEESGVYAFQVIPTEGVNSELTQDAVTQLRETDNIVADVEFGVAGNASATIDITNKLADALPGYLALVIGFSLVVLIMVFRSILVPVIATIGFVLSLIATFGAITAIYQLGFLGSLFDVAEPAPLTAFLPIIIIGILFGLAMDYQLFIASGIREAYVHGATARVAVQQGLQLGRSVVIAAALIMISVFAGFIFSDTIMIRAVGFGLAFGVLVDAFIVRLTFMPAALHLVGNAAWWLPRWLDRLLPNLDVEGEQLSREHARKIEAG